MIEVLEPGLETAVQDWPGRVGYGALGFPPSGPMDSWSFRLANVLVGNAPGEAALECQFVGPALRFDAPAIIALTGADMQATVDGEPCPAWESFAVAAGQTLKMSFAVTGARAYLAIAGGIATEPWLGSRATFRLAGVGGLAGGALKSGQQIPLGRGHGQAGRRVRPEQRPLLATERRWAIEAVRGPNDDWVDAAGHAMFLGSDWRLSSKSDRMGFRLEGPEWTFTDKALHKLPEHGSEPANIVDQGYPLGAVNLAGQTPIILMNDGPNMGGFINPYTIPQCAFWKLGQARPGEILNFRECSVAEAQARARELNELCSEVSVEDV